MNKLLVRTLSSIGIVTVMILSLLTHQTVFGALMVIVLYFALNEFYQMAFGSLFNLQRFLAVFTSECFLILEYAVLFNGLSSRYLALVLVPLLVLCISFLFISEGAKTMLERLPYIFFGLVYIGLPIALSPRMVYHMGVFNGKLMFALFIIIWASDVGAYLVGSTLGQRPGSRRLAPSISPKKSWWGVVGGLFLAVITSVVLFSIGWLRGSYFLSVVLSIIISITSVCGDLFESLWKRHFGVKDSGNLIPGHGGMLDRIDSALFAIPAASVFLMIFNLL